LVWGTNVVDACVDEYHCEDQEPSNGFGPDGQDNIDGEKGRPSLLMAAFKTLSGSSHSLVESITTTFPPPHCVVPEPERTE